MCHPNACRKVVKQTTNEHLRFPPGYHHSALGLYTRCNVPVFHKPIVDKPVRGVPLLNRVYLKMQIGVNTFSQKTAII